MDSRRDGITRVAQKLTVATSQFFRCHGLQRVPSNADGLGAHDILYWLIFIGLLSGWFLFLFMPARQRLTSLEERVLVLNGHLKAEQRELTRLQRGIAALERGDPSAWERAARGQLGWVGPGEMLDMAALPPVVRPAPANNNRPPNANQKQPVLRPAIPPLPAPSAQLRLAGLPRASATPAPASRNSRSPAPALTRARPPAR